MSTQCGNKNKSTKQNKVKLFSKYFQTLESSTFCYIKYKRLHQKNQTTSIHHRATNKTNFFSSYCWQSTSAFLVQLFFKHSKILAVLKVWFTAHFLNHFNGLWKKLDVIIQLLQLKFASQNLNTWVLACRNKLCRMAPNAGDESKIISEYFHSILSSLL